MARLLLTDEEWELLCDVFPEPAKTGRPRRDARTEFFQGGGVAVMGYSQGGGAAHDLIEMLTTHYEEQQVNFVAMLTVYIDAIERQIFPLNDPIQETDYPNNAFHLLNIFQRNDPTFLGDFVDTDDPDIPFGVTIEQIPTHETGGWNNSLTHEQIDDDLQVKQRMRLRLEQRLIRR